MVRLFKSRLFIAMFAFAAIAMVSACSLMDSQADKRLGIACTDQVRFARAGMLTDMLDKHYGDEFPAHVERLRQKTKLMLLALHAGAGVDAAGDSYKADFVSFAAAILVKRGIKVALGGYADAIDKLKVLPELVADVNEIEAKVDIACAHEASSG